jgi:hypothetical protein
VPELISFAADRDALLGLTGDLVRELDDFHHRVVQIDRIAETLLTTLDRSDADAPGFHALLTLRLIASEYGRAYDAVKDATHSRPGVLASATSSRKSS